jgi:hypothetical protein
MTKIPHVLATAILLTAFVLVTAVSQDGSSDETLEPTTTSDGYKMVETIEMTAQWKVVDDQLEIILTSPTDGWLAIGFDPSSVMQDADIYIGYIDDEGNVTVRDDYGTWFTSHEADTSLGGSNHATVLGGSESDEGSRIRFRIPLESGDQYDNPLEEGNEHVMMLAYGTNDDIGKRHKNRVSFTVEL